MYKILLTGSSGFIGSNILNSFSEKYKIYIVVRKKNSRRLPKKNNIKVINFKSYESLNSKLKKIKVDTVIHCATHYTKVHEFSDIKKFCKSNLLLGNIILENLNSMKVKKFINFSTVWEDDNAKKNNIKNISFYCGDLKDILNTDVMNNILLPSIIIVDPPRPGLHPNTVKNLLVLRPNKIIYVSCNPATMARDIEILINEKYSIKDLQPIDMFPHTPHVECVTTLILN